MNSVKSLTLLKVNRQQDASLNISTLLILSVDFFLKLLLLFVSDTPCAEENSKLFRFEAVFCICYILLERLPRTMRPVAFRMLKCAKFSFKSSMNGF